MLVKSESTSKLPIDNVGSSSQISEFLVQGFSMGNKNLLKLYVGVCKTDRVGPNRWGKATVYL